MTRHLAFVLFALGAATAGAALGPRYGGTLTVGVLELPGSMETIPPDRDGGRLLAGLVSETLVHVTADGSPAPGLARTWSSAASGREWTLPLAETATFQDGPPVTAADALRSLHRFLRGPGIAALHLSRSLEGGTAFRARQAEDLAGVSVLDDTRIVLRLAHAETWPLAPLASPAAAITSPSGGGAGPFVTSVLVPGRRAAFTPFAGHVRGRPYLDQVEVLAFGDRAALRNARKAGRIDVGLDVGPAAVSAMLLLRIDPTRPPLQSREDRALLSRALDRRELVSRLVPGGQALSSLLLSAPHSPPDVAPAPPRDPLRGRVTLAVGRDVPPVVSQRIVAHLLDLGLSVDAVPEPGPPAGAELRLLLFLPEVAEEGLALEELAALVPPVPAAREALEAAAREPDPGRRRAFLGRAGEALRHEATLVPLAAFPLATAAGVGVHGLLVDPTGCLRLEDAWREP